MQKVLVGLLVISSLVSCSSGPKKKVLIMGRGEITANGTDIVMKDGTGHVEKEIEIDSKTTDVSVDAGAGKTTMKVPAEPGYYILNLKKDTLVGSGQNLGKDLSRGDVMSQEELKLVIDSMQKLTIGANVKPGGRNFIVFPNQVVKISANPGAHVYGPFNGIPSEIDPEKDGSMPELIKVYTNTQLRQNIANLKKATI